MALSDLAVFTEYTYESVVQVVAQQVALFNEAAAGTFTLRPADHSGDFSDRAFWQRFQGLVRRRNAYGSGNIPEINMTMLTDSMVKIAAGTPAVRMDPGQFEWINANPEQAGAAMGQQLAADMVRDMFNVALSSMLAAHVQVPNLVKDQSAVGDGKLSLAAFNIAQAVYGDRWRNLAAWVMHSTAMFGLFGTNITNNERLYTFADLAISRDPFGRPFIVSDAPALMIPAAGPNPAYYYTLGVTPGAALVDQNDDFIDNWSTDNGKENITRTYQAEWSYNVGIKGFTWDKTSGGKSPTDAALVSSANWDRVTGFNDRDLGCVIIKTQ